MADPTVAIRHLVKQRLVDILTGVADQVPVQYTRDDRTAEDERIWLSDCRTVLHEIPVFSGPLQRAQRQDNFEFDVHIEARSPGADTGFEADTRAMELAALVEDALASAPGIGPGAIPGSLMPGVQWAQITGFEGPSQTPFATQQLEGYMSYVSLTVEVHTRLH
jgi:hypothetical protein